MSTFGAVIADKIKNMRNKTSGERGGLPKNDNKKIAKYDKLLLERTG